MKNALLVRTLLVVALLAWVTGSRTPARAQTDSIWGNASEQVYLFNIYFTLDSNPRLTASLELSPEQLGELKKVTQEYRERQNEGLKQYQADQKLGDSRLAVELYTEGNTALREEFGQKFEAVLLVHQANRLKQIVRQQASRYRGWSGGPGYSVAGDGLNLPLQLAGELELDEREIKGLADSIATIREEMELEIRRARQEAYERVLRELSTEQRKKLRELVGDPFDFETSRREQQEEVQRRASERVRQQKEFESKGYGQ